MMEPQSLQMHCLKHVLMSQKCAKAGCTRVPMSFQILKGEEVLWCQKHYEISQFYHDALHMYCTHHNGQRPYRVHIGDSTVYIHDNDIDGLYIHHQGPLYCYENIVRVFIGDNYGKQKGNTILLEVKPQHYVYIAGSLYAFETKDVIKSYYSHLGSNDIPGPVAVGERYVYYMKERRVFDKALFSLETDWWGAAMPLVSKGFAMDGGVLSIN